MSKNTINLIFIFGFFVFLTAGLAKTVFFPKDINYYENRKAVALEMPTAQAFISGTLQDNVEDSIADQAFFAQRMKKAYNTAVSKYMNLALSPIAVKYPTEYIRVGTYYLYDRDNLIFAPYDFNAISIELDNRIEGLNKLAKKYPDIDFYTYYIEKDTDINFKYNVKIGVSEYLKENINFPDENKQTFKIDDFKTFDSYFYKTDHHWNAAGSYEGYKAVVKMLLPYETEFLKIEDTVSISDRFSGSKTLTEETALYSEKFLAYKLNYPKMTIYENGDLVADYGNQEAFINGKDGKLTYGDFYGDDLGEIILDTGRADRENLMIVGESFDNAILKSVASHFNRTVSIDMRYYKNYMGKDFSFSEYLKANDIDKVLFIGNIDYFVSDIFEVE